MRSKLGYTDLNLILEDFFKDVLNIIHGTNLANLNQERSNNPGLDLGDKGRKIAYQITSRNKADKFKETFSSLTREQLATYSEIYILLIGPVRTTPSVSDIKKGRRTFNKSNVLTIDQLCKSAVDMQVDDLQRLHDYIIGQVARVKIELELPGPEGGYATNMSDYFEEPPVMKLGDGTKYCGFHDGVIGFKAKPDSVRESFRKLSSKLSKLPRITREFYGYLLKHRDQREDECIVVNHDILKRICRWPDLAGELRVLQDAGLIEWQDVDLDYRSPSFWVWMPGTAEAPLDISVAYYIETKGMDFGAIFRDLNFEDF